MIELGLNHLIFFEQGFIVLNLLIANFNMVWLYWVNAFA